MLRARAWDMLRQATPPAWRRRLKRSAWFAPVTARLFGNAMYSRSYYDDIERLEAESAPRLAAWIAERLAPRTTIDIGCGSGLLMDALRRHGIEVHGVDASAEGIRRARARRLPVEALDLTSDRPLPGGPYDLAVSCEVAEHLDARHAARFVERLADAAPTVFLTAAEPDSGIGPGLHHVNEQPHAYWIALMRRRGYRLDDEATSDARRALADPRIVEYLRRPLVFRRSA